MIKKLVFISIITSMIGNASVFAIDLGIIQLSIYRVIIVSLFLSTIIDISMKGARIQFNNQSDNNYSIKLMVIWVIYTFFSLIWVKDYNAWMRALFFLSVGLMAAVTFSQYLKNKFDILLAFRLIFIMVLIHNILGWFEIITDNYLFLPIDNIAKYSRLNHPVSTFINTNDFATFMLFSFWVSYICLMNTKNKTMKYICFFSKISNVLLLIYTSSRANILGFLLSIMVFILLSIPKKWAKNILLSLLTLLGIILLTVLLNPKMVNNLLVLVSENLGFNFTQLYESDFVRTNLIKNGLFFLRSTFGFGVGAGNIEYWMSHKAIFNTEQIFNIHNWWFEILVSYGLIIFVMYLIFYVKLFKNFYSKFTYSKNKVDKSMSLGIMCFMIGYVVGSISSSSNINSEWLWVFWGIAVAYQGINELKPKIINNRNGDINIV